LRRSWHVDPR